MGNICSKLFGPKKEERMDDLGQTQRWKSEANNQYQKIVSTMLSLAASALILPTLVLREFLGIPKEVSLVKYLTISVYIAWSFLLLTMLCGIFFYYASAKWLKQAYGGPVHFSSKAIENFLDWSFWLMISFFLIGISCLIWFISTSKMG